MRRARVADTNADVVVEDVDPPVRIPASLDEGDALGLPRHIRLERHRHATLGLDHRLRLLRRLQVAVDKKQLRMLPGEQDGSRATVPNRRAWGLASADND